MPQTTTPHNTTTTRQRTTGWTNIKDPGAYVEVETGKLLRVPKQALLGSSPVIQFVGRKESTFVKLSSDSEIALDQARSLSTDNDITPTF